MRIALLTGAVGWRGAGASFAKVAGGLRDRGHETLLVTAAPRLTARFQEEGLPVVQLSARNTGPREVWALYRTLRRLRAQAIMVDTPRDLRLAAYATAPLGVRIVYRYNLNYRAARGHLADRMYARHAALLVYQSQFIRDDAVRQSPWLGARPSVRIANGYDTRRFAPDPERGSAFRAAYGIAAEEFVMLTPGKLAANKGHDTAFDALARLSSEGRRFTYVVLGDGIRESALRATADRSSFRTVFTGFLAPDDVAAALNAADLIVHPSPTEIFPNAVGEAMSCARPVIATAAGGTIELVGTDGVAGRLVPPRDPFALASAASGLWDDADRRVALGRAARQRIEREFPVSSMVDAYEAAFARVTGRAEGWRAG